MPLITTVTNLDYLISALQLQYGDYDGTLFSEAVYRTALVNGVKYLQNRWNSKYLIDSDSNVYRNTDTSLFFVDSPPIVQQVDEQAIILAAIIILRQVSVTGSSSSFSSWSTPDLSYSNIQSSKIKTDLWRQAIADLNDWFGKKLAAPQKTFNYTVDGWYPTAMPIDNNV